MKIKITNYIFAIRMARMYGVSFPWFLPRIRCLKKIQNTKLYNEGDKIRISGLDYVAHEYNGNYVFIKVDASD